MIKKIRSWKILESKAGFSMVELAAVITIIIILASMGTIVFRGVQERARDGRRQADLEAIQTALGVYYQEHYNYPGESASACDTSRGVCASPCSSCSGSDWLESDGLADELESDYIRELPIDPVNSDLYYYRYEPVCGETDSACGRSFDCSGAGNCCQYELSARLEGGSTLTVCGP